MYDIKIISVSPLPNYKLLLGLSTGEKRIFDVKPYIRGSLFGKLKDKTYFSKVKIIYHGWSVAWPDGQDIEPSDLFDLSTPV